MTTQEIEHLASILRSTVAVRPRLLTVDQAAIYLGRTPDAVRCLERRGDLPTVRSDSRVMFDVQDLDKWIEQNKVARR